MVFLFSLSIAINLPGIQPKSNMPNSVVSIETDQNATASTNEENPDPSLSPKISIPENIRPLLPVIKKYSRIYGFDWRLILAVIEQESSFRHDAISPRGAYGLLQIMPETGEELVLNVSHIYDYRIPEQNIIAGIHYLWMQFNRFYSKGLDSLECLKLALAAYNAGPGRVLDAQKLALYFSEDPNKWENIKTFLPLLSGEYYTLHTYVWDTGRPRSGYFKNYRETVNYVEKIMRNYEKYKKHFAQ
jgi:membrane-bound lytic murein transglycosylase F